MLVNHRKGRFGHDRRSARYRAMVAAGLWLRAGLVALSVEVITLIMLATGEATPWIEIAIALVAGVIARWSWRRARSALAAESAETGEASPATREPQRGGFDRRVEVAVSR